MLFRRAKTTYISFGKGHFTVVKLQQQKRVSFIIAHHRHGINRVLSSDTNVPTEIETDACNYCSDHCQTYLKKKKNAAYYCV